MAKRTTGTLKRGKPPKDWRPVFLKALAESGNVGHSLRKAKVGKTSVYQCRKEEPGFARDWDDALGYAVDDMEVEARRRAVKGTAKPVFQKGEQVGTIQEYSDTLLIFLLKANRPEKFRDGYDAMKQLGDMLTRAQQFSIPTTDDRPEPDAAS